MKAVIFDLFGTLVPNVPPPKFREILVETAALFDVDADAYEQHWHRTFPHRMDGRIMDGDHQFISILDELGATADEPTLKKASAARRKFLLRSLQPKHDAIACLEGILERGLCLALATDCSSMTPELLDQTDLGKFFSVRAVSAHLKTRKPDPIMYNHVLTGLDVSGSDCMYVGDGNSHELPGAKRHGMRTVWVDNGADQHAKERFEPGGDHQVQELSELLTILDDVMA